MRDELATDQSIEPDSVVDSHRALWCAVIQTQWDLAFNSPQAVKNRDQRSARDWFGSRDFAIATTLAGLDPAYLFYGFQQRMAQETAAGTGA